jgi:RimJ/RimL family protein N-acetyltransferase
VAYDQSVPTAHVLETDRLLLRPWASEDVALLAALSSNPRVTRYIGDGLTWTALKAITVSDRALSHWREHGFGWRVVVELATGTGIGLIALNLMGPGTAGVDPGDHEIGWWLGPERWGYGFATEAARAVAADAFTQLRVPHLTARIRPENTGSIQVATRLGMQHEFNTVADPGVAVAVYRVPPVPPDPTV